MITKRKFCYFVIWTPNGIEIDLIERDDMFWTTDKILKLDTYILSEMCFAGADRSPLPSQTTI